MFRIKKISIFNGQDHKDYPFSDNSYIYGSNNVGKTAFVEVIDYVLGRSEDLSHDGLENIDSVEAYITNDKTELWIKRNLDGEYLYKRTNNSGYSVVSDEKYKDIISEIITSNPNKRAVEVYKKVFEENITYRSFSFLNFIDEVGQGDLDAIFTRGKEIKHLVRYRKLMDFLFNYKNSERIYEKNIELERIETELKELYSNSQKYQLNLESIKNLFGRIGLDYYGDLSADKKSFDDYKRLFARDNTKPNSDLAYLIRASHSLAEEIKVYNYLKNQTEETSTRKDRTKNLLLLLRTIVADNPKFEEEVATICQMVEEIDNDKIILSLADYDESIEKIIAEKEKIDSEISVLKNQATELEYEQTIKLIALIDNCFSNIDSNISIEKANQLEKKKTEIKREIKKLKEEYSVKSIENFNKELTKLYLNSSIKDANYLIEDRNKDGFSLAFKPFSQVLVAYRKEDESIVSYIPGSLARRTYLQILVYLCMFKFLKENFNNFIYLPLLIMDSPEQSMDIGSLEEVYASIVGIANEIGIQTIYVSKALPKNVKRRDLIDIRDGFNPYHNI